MKLNLLIRTYIVENLYTSLFDIPNHIDSNNIEIYIHNDNPNMCEQFITIIKEFRIKYPNYVVHTIQEQENQDMFMSYINSIEYFNEENYWTMLLDDDDTLCDSDIIEYLSKQVGSDVCIKYKIYNVINNSKYLSHFLWHRIYPTKFLKKMFEYKYLIVDLLLKYNNSIKFNRLEDKLLCDIMNVFFNLEIIIFDTPLVNYNIYDHNINGYERNTNINIFNIFNNHKRYINTKRIINSIICDIKQYLQNENKNN